MAIRPNVRAALLCLCACASLCSMLHAQGHAFTVEQILGFPSPDNLIASPVGSTVAWTFNERGVRNIYTASGPAFEAPQSHGLYGRRRPGTDSTILLERRKNDRLRSRR